ncbi:MAG: prolipoprotein diacylglyceryl transferase [Rhodothermaceae bacterium]|nr:prolipoprotein diacylglyceryl transferase [Rhodothermaceae bacterium]
MYPRLTDLFKDIFGFDLPLPIYSFGFMVAVALVTAAWVSRRELDRLYAAGRVGAVTVKERDGKGRERTVKASPSVLIWTMMLVAAVSGVVGSKLFHLIDYWDRFVADPAGMLFNAGGLTFYGGLIAGTLAVATYIKRKGLAIRPVADALAPSLILGYGIGRIGCYLAGDGDWGVCSSLADKPAWIPGFLWSETFPRNIFGVDVIADTAEKGQRLGFPADLCVGADGVFPTMLHETGMALIIFGILWAVRKHPFQAGWLFSLYLVFNGIERFLIEIIRLNPDVLGPLSQAQLIALGLIAFGLVGLAITTRRRTGTDAPSPSVPEPATA